MEGVSLEAKDEAGNKVLITLVKNELAKPTQEVETETETEENLHKLHDLVDEGLLTKQQAEHIAE